MSKNQNLPISSRPLISSSADKRIPIVYFNGRSIPAVHTLAKPTIK